MSSESISKISSISTSTASVCNETNETNNDLNFNIIIEEIGFSYRDRERKKDVGLAFKKGQYY